MPGRVLLDTNIVIALFSGEKVVSQRFASREISVSSTVLGKLYYGARKSAHTAANLARVDEFAASVKVLDCDVLTAQHYGQIKDRLRVRGRPIPENDIWIASVALQFGLPLATRDDHFKEVEDLTLVRGLVNFVQRIILHREVMHWRAPLKVTTTPRWTHSAFLVSDEPIEKSDEVKPDVILDYDKDGNVVGLEILDAYRSGPPLLAT